VHGSKQTWSTNTAAGNLTSVANTNHLTHMTGMIENQAMIARWNNNTNVVKTVDMFGTAETSTNPCLITHRF
jgi:hypothetical protein